MVSHKTRKSVVGLFDGDEEDRGSSSQAGYPGALKVSPAFRSVSPSLIDPGDVSSWSIAATQGKDPSSPTLSTLGLSSIRQNSFDGVSMKKHTLGSELGSEFGDDWGENAGNHHLRTSSLYDLAGLVVSREGSPGLSPGASPPENPSFVFSSPGMTTSDGDWDEADNDIGPSEAGTTTPNHSRGLQLNLGFSTPRPSKSHEILRASTSLPEPRSTRNYRLSQTVRNRTGRWVKGRYGGEGTSVDHGSLPRRRRPFNKPSSHASRGSDASVIFSETFDTVVRQLSFSGTPDCGDMEEDEGESEATMKQIIRAPRSENSVAIPPPLKEQGFVGFILEVWLWLQFAIVVLVFLWAMARRGPKSVLQEAERRKSMPITATR